jgi:hypothetical protein
VSSVKVNLLCTSLPLSCSNAPERFGIIPLRQRKMMCWLSVVAQYGKPIGAVRHTRYLDMYPKSFAFNRYDEFKNVLCEF